MSTRVMGWAVVYSNAAHTLFFDQEKAKRVAAQDDVVVVPLVDGNEAEAREKALRGLLERAYGMLVNLACPCEGRGCEDKYGQTRVDVLAAIEKELGS